MQEHNKNNIASLNRSEIKAAIKNLKLAIEFNQMKDDSITYFLYDVACNLDDALFIKQEIESRVDVYISIETSPYLTQFKIYLGE